MFAKNFVFVLLVVFVAVVSCEPQKRSAKVIRVRNEKFTGRNGLRALQRVYRKYGMPLGGLPQPNTAAQFARRANSTGGQGGKGIVSAVPEPNDVEYISPVSVGGQMVNLAFDTGSSDLWVFTSALSPQAQAGHGIYNPTTSTSFALMQGSSFSISYGDGSGAAGLVGTDVVDVGGASVQAQAVELATEVSQEFVQDQNSDGLMGLAFSSLNTVQPQKQKTFFDNVMTSLAEPLFTADLRRNTSGAYEFGVIDQSKFTGPMTWVPINTTSGFWQFSSEKFAVNGGAPMPATSGGQAIADTGTTLLLADPAIVQGYYSQVQGAKNDAQQGGFVVPCAANMPDLSLDIGGMYMARIAGNDLKFVPVDAQTCFGGLQAAPAGHVGIYGDILFRSQFVAFNGGNQSLGLAPHQG